MQELLRIEHLSKTFPGQVALDDVELSVAPGEVHALVGQNGSGKSTLIKVLAGYHQPDAGASAWVDGAPLALGDGPAAQAAGIRFVHQDLGLVGSISTVENLALTVGYRTGAGRRIRWRDERRKAHEALAALGLADIDVRAPVETLAPSQRTAVAIARALINWEDGAKLLVLDEPTATLPGDDVTRLFEVIGRLKARGVSILYVSHHIDEVFALADRVTVLRDGERVATVPVHGLDHHGLIELIVGHRVEAALATDAVTSGKIILKVRELSGGTVHGFDLDVHEGEIVGLAGITGSGREHVIGLIAGQLRRTGGHVVLDDNVIPSYAPRKAIEHGVAFVPADRAMRGTISTMTVRENLSLADLKPHFVRGRLRRSREVHDTKHWIGRLSIKTHSTESMITSLSGGNQQKVMLGKALRLSPKLLLLDEPTQGIDVGAKEQIHRIVDEAGSGGMAVLVSSTDTDELVRLCHRVVVLAHGQVAATLIGDHIATERIETTQLESSPEGLMLKKLALDKYSALYLWAVFMIWFGFTRTDTFLSTTTFKLVVIENVITGVLALAFLIPLSTGTYDLSVGAMMSMALVITAYLSKHHVMHPALAMLVALASCAVAGLISGFFVVKLKVNSFIATLGMSQVITAFILHTSSQSITSPFTQSYMDIGAKPLFGLPRFVYFLGILALIIWFVFEHTPLGRFMFATGGNPEAARLAGVRTDRLIWGSLVASALVAGFAGIVYSWKVGNYAQSVGPGYLFPAIAAVFFGASQLKGRPNVWGALIALYALAWGIKGLQLTFSTNTIWIEPLFQGVSLLAAVSLASWRGIVKVGKKKPTDPSLEPLAVTSNVVQKPAEGDLVSQPSAG